MSLSLPTSQYAQAVLVGLMVTALHLFWLTSDNPLLTEIRQRMDWLLYDIRLFYSLDENPEPAFDVVIVDVDERSLTEQGRWPWNRTKVATLINRLGDAGVAVTALDISFPEPQSNPATRVLVHVSQQNPQSELMTLLHQAEDEMNADDDLASSFSGNEVVPGFIFVNEETSKGQLPAPLVVSNDLPAHRWGILSVDGYISNTAALTQAATAGSGFYSVQEDQDGTLRQYNLMLEHDGELYASLVLEALRVFLFTDTVELVRADTVGEVRLKGLRMSGLEVPLNPNGQMLIPFRGRSGQIPSVSATDVIEGRVDPADLEGRIAFIGSTAKALFDFRSTPVQAQFPGLEVHPTVAQGILDGNLKSYPTWADAANLLLVLLTGLLFAFLLPMLSGGWLIMVSAAYLISYAWFNNWLWTSEGLALDAFVLVSLVAFQSIVIFVFGFISERQARLQVTGMFGQYVPPELVSEMSSSPETALSFEGDRRDMTVLFADIRNFTRISEGMEPAELKDLLNRYLTPMTEIIFNHNGTIDKYMGDLVMAFWGAPLNDPDHVKNALKTSIEMQRETDRVSAEFAELGYPEIKIGIGLNTGEMNVGNMGSEYRRAYTVLGDNVNLGSRIEGLTKFYGTRILVGENTFEACRDLYEFRFIDKVLVKGKEEPVSLYEPLGQKGEVADNHLLERQRYMTAIEAYQAGDWRDAHQLFAELSKSSPECELYRVYIDRSAGEPEADWNGVFEHTAK